MDLSYEEEKRKEFRNILFDLSVSQDTLQKEDERVKFYQRFEDLYHTSSDGKKFRHFYSDIFSVLIEINRELKPGNIDILGQNIGIIRKQYVPSRWDETGEQPIDISDCLKKLYDHLSLDIARLKYVDVSDLYTRQENTISELRAQVSVASKKANILCEEVESIAEDVRSAQEDVRSAQKEHIAILGIFAAVVLAFTGGIAFSTSVLENLHVSSVYRVVLVSLIIGMVLINILYGLFYYVDRLVNNNDERKITPLLISNIVFVMLMVATVCAWCGGWVEVRNDRIDRRLLEQDKVVVSVPLDSTEDVNEAIEDTSAEDGNLEDDRSEDGIGE